MKKNWVSCCGLILLLFINPVLTYASVQQGTTKPTLATLDRKIAGLTKRFSLLESNVARFQFGGSLVIEPTVSPDNENLGMMAINQYMDLYLDAAIEQNIQFSLRMAQPGRWGIQYQEAGSNAMPLFSPFLVNEAFLRVAMKKQQDYLGRFRYSLGQYGTIADLFVNPVEGLVIQQQLGNFYVIGLYSRISPLEDYSAGRIGWASPNLVIGLNLVPNGLSGEKAYSIDWSWNQGATEIKAELGWYSFYLEGNLDYRVDWTPGILAGYSKTLRSGGLCQIKAGYFPKTFTPSSSSLGHVSGVMREWFVPNSQGGEVYFRKKITNHWEMENRFIALAPVDNPQLGFDYRLRSSFVRTFSPVNQAQVGIEGNTAGGKFYSRAFISWMLRF
ncbi:MAG: hypothetical protein K6U80_07935 [Firmicutes bacterium]|nr:hypothetical protein [Bacillota bacterium]